MQGKSNKQYEDHGKFFMMAMTGIFVLFVSLLAWNELQGHETINEVVKSFASAMIN